MLIKRSDYERIYQIISAIVESEDGDPAHACINFSVFGAHILTEHFKLDPKVKCGLAAFHVGGDNDVLCFGVLCEEGVTFSKDGFHCWIEVEGWIVDFMAPQFPKLTGSPDARKPKMFQKEALAMSNDPNDMSEMGNFFLKHDQNFSESMLVPQLEKLGIQDLAGICSDWFKKTPRRIPSSMATLDQHGKRRDIKLKTTKLRSNW